MRDIGDNAAIGGCIQDFRLDFPVFDNSRLRGGWRASEPILGDSGVQGDIFQFCQRLKRLTAGKIAGLRLRVKRQVAKFFIR